MQGAFAAAAAVPWSPTAQRVAAAEKGYAVHVEANGLKPATRYAYRFTLGGFASDGTTLTAPAAGALPDRLRFAFCSSAEYEFSYPHAYELMARDDPA